MAASTRLGSFGYGTRRTGSFSGKEQETAKTGLGFAATRLGFGGYATRLTGDFSGKEREATKTRLGFVGYATRLTGDFSGKQQQAASTRLGFGGYATRLTGDFFGKQEQLSELELVGGGESEIGEIVGEGEGISEVLETPAIVGYIVDVFWTTGSATVITDDVVRVNISRPLWNLFDGVSPGEMQVEVINVSGKYTPDNPNGPFAGLIKNGKECRAFAYPSSGTAVQLFQGFLDQISLPANDVDGGRALLSFRDRAREFRNRTLNTSLWVDYNISSLYENVLREAGVILDAQSVSIAAMPDIADLTWFRDVSVDSALTDMISFNFSKGYVSRTGVTTILDRYYDQNVTNVRSYSQFLSLDYSLTDDAVINDARFESSPREAFPTVSTLSYITRSIPIPPLSSVAFVTEYIDPANGRAVPATNLVPPVANTDYYVGTIDAFGVIPLGTVPTNEATPTTSVSVQFFGETAVSSLYNSRAQTVYINKFQIRGQHIPDAPKLQAITISSSSQSIYGKRSFFLSSQLLGKREYLHDYGTFLVDRQKDSIPDIRAAIRNETSHNTMSLEPGSLISITNSSTAIGSLHFIKRLEHDIDMSSGLQHTISMDLELVMEYSIWTLGHPTRGILDAGNTLGF